MPDPRSITTKPEHRLLRARTFKRDPTCSFTLEVTGKHQLSTSNHEQVKWVPAAPDNASWADTVEYKWESKVSQDGSAKLFPVLVKHSYVAKYADEDAIVSSSQDIYKAYLYAVRLLQAAGRNLRRPEALLYLQLSPARPCCVCWKLLINTRMPVQPVEPVVQVSCRPETLPVQFMAEQVVCAVCAVKKLYCQASPLPCPAAACCPLLPQQVTRPTTPTAPVKPPVKTTTTSYDISDDEDSSDDEEADMIVIVRPRRAPKPKVPTGWGPSPLPRHTFTAKVDYGCQLYSGNNLPLPFLHAVPGASCGDLLELAVVWEASSDGTHTQVAKLLRHHPAAACWQLGLVADSVAAVKQVVRAASFSW
jgi:hypothetical protein